ncbi:MAG: class I SAM-dependent methyltransferase [Firmicutes bacterium]|nr:class I SAM-dependent methyltransferase [Bacillota bacterium]
MAESYYVLERFSECERMIAEQIEVMPTKRRAIEIHKERNNTHQAKDTYSELKLIKEKLEDTIRQLGLLFGEVEMVEESVFCTKLYASFKEFNLMTPDYTKLIGVLKVLKNKIPQNETITNKVIGRLMNNVKMGYFPTDLEHVKIIKSALVFPDCTVNVLDPCCGCGLALEMLCMGENATTFGIELDESRGKEAESRINRVGFGSFFHSGISARAFHALFLNPPYLSVMTENGRARNEKRFLVDSMHQLMKDGVLIYIIPYYRLTYDICRVICDNFQNISIYRFSDSEFSKFKQVVIFGTKKNKGDGKKAAEKLSEYALQPERIPMISALKEKSYSLPETPMTVRDFRGAVFNLGELKRQMAKSKSTEMFFEKSRVDSMEKRPLLPLNLGQIGLIGGSGLINGYVGCDKPHIIKGRVIKEIKRRENQDEGTLTETRVNRMLFNILTPDGVKRLA